MQVRAGPSDPSVPIVLVLVLVLVLDYDYEDDDEDEGGGGRLSSRPVPGRRFPY
jgi:hypothetical protein